MQSTRYTVAGVVSLVGGGVAILSQYLITPLKGADVATAELLDKAAAHHTAMGGALALDVPLLLAAPAMLFIGALAGMRTSRFAAVATGLLFFPLLMSLPPVVGFDGLVYFAAAQPDRGAMTQLVDSWQGSAYFAVGLFPYILCQLIGSVMMAVALLRVRTVPRWTAVAVGAWPFLTTAGIVLGATAVAVVGYAVLLACWSACATSIVRQRATLDTESVLVSA